MGGPEYGYNLSVRNRFSDLYLMSSMKTANSRAKWEQEVLSKEFTREHESCGTQK